MNGYNIISKFETWVDDNTELSAADELDLLNRVYTELCAERPWEFLKVAYSDSISGTSISLPSDFKEIAETIDDSGEYDEMKKLVWIGDTYYQVVPYSQRKRYDTTAGYCWVDLANSLLVFSTSVSGTVEFDYIKYPADLTLISSPLFPAQFQAILYHLMAADDYIIQQFDKAKSYRDSNLERAAEIKEKMEIWDGNLKLE